MYLTPYSDPYLSIEAIDYTLNIETVDVYIQSLEQQVTETPILLNDYEKRYDADSAPPRNCSRDFLSKMKSNI